MPPGKPEASFNQDVDGSYTLEKGDSLALRYRILFHTGDAKSAKIAEAFERYAR